MLGRAKIFLFFFNSASIQSGIHDHLNDMREWEALRLRGCVGELREHDGQMRGVMKS